MKEPNNPPFQTIMQAVKTTGLSAYFLRQGVRAGTIPHIKSGDRYLVNVPALIEKLDRESRAACGGGTDFEA